MKNNWKKVKLGDAVEIIDGDRGKNYPKGNEFFDNEYCLFLNTKNVLDGDFCFSEKMFITQEKDKVLRKGKLKRGDYVLTTRGTLGNFAYYSISTPFDNIRINSGMVVFRVKKERVMEKFFCCYLRSVFFKNQVLQRSSGSAQPQLPIRDLKNFDIILPPKNIQKKIVSVLSAYDDLIEVNNKRIKILEEMTQRIYNEWFVDFKFPGHKKVKIKNGVPEGWEKSKLEDVVYNIKQKYKEQEHGNLPLLDLGRIPRKSLSVNNYGLSDEIKTARKIFDTHDILFGNIRVHFHKVVFAMKSGITNSSVFVFRAKNPIYQNFFINYFFSDDLVAWAVQNSGGMKMPTIAWDVFKEKKLTLPEESIIKKFNIIIQPIINLLLNLNLQSENLRETRDLLLPKLMSGEIEAK